MTNDEKTARAAASAAADEAKYRFFADSLLSMMRALDIKKEIE